MKKNFLNKIIIFSIYIILLILIYNFYNDYNKKIIDKSKVVNFFDTVNESNRKQDDYIAVIQIPKINLEKGIYNIDNPLNNVDKNIAVLRETIWPDQKNSHIILASHSGNSDISYFKKLNKLKINDEIFFYYNNKKYVYSINNIYEVEKRKYINLDLSNDDISLITCKGKNNQIIYHGKLNKILNI